MHSKKKKKNKKIGEREKPVGEEGSLFFPQKCFCLSVIIYFSVSVSCECVRVHGGKMTKHHRAEPTLAHIVKSWQ